MEIYVHIPFCLKKCLYCDFFSGPFSKEAQDAYFEQVKEEIRTTPFAGFEPVTSLFFGGGTPSAADPEKIREIMEELHRHFAFSEDAEITLECNPGTVDALKLADYRAMGINRLSMGLQSADDRLLEKLGRIHRYGDFLESFRAARAAGFTNINVDLMSALPGDTPENFEKGLHKVIDLRPEHLSVYSLIIEENTPFYARYGPSGTQVGELPTEEEDREIYHRTAAVLSDAGYRQYEISNFAKPGKACRQNTGYWTGETYLGFGAAAASYIDGKRFKNPLRLDYLSGPLIECETLSREDRITEFMILGLRMNRGVSKQEFLRRFGESMDERFAEQIRKFVSFGAAEETVEDGETWFRLTDYGRDVANAVMEAFL